MPTVRPFLPWLLFVWVVVGCSGATVTATTAPASPAPPTPVPTRVPPTATRLPATATDLPATPTNIGQGEPATAGPNVQPTSSEPPAPTATPTPDPALAAILSYLEARAAADVTRVTDLSCAAWKPQAVTEAVSFRSMNAKLQDVACQVAGADGGFTLVTCGGKIITTYGPETREWDLSNQIYQAAPEEGEWKMCGYN